VKNRSTTVLLSRLAQPLGLLLVAAAFLIGTPAAKAAGPSGPASPVGEVVFTIGQATGQTAANQAPQALQKGAPVSVGQTLRTGPNGHIHIRFIDQGFVSVRPGSELLIEDFAFDAKNPQASRVKFSLKQGTGRVISGQAGQSAKENFRLNTPVSAIGIRGTDFVVQTTKDLTRVAVYQGAVVVSPFINGCTAAGTGPCAGSLATDLVGSLTSQYLEVRPAALPKLVNPEAGAAGRVFPPANPNEPAAGGPAPEKSGAAVDLPTARSIGQLQQSDSFSWGRWGSGAAPAGYEQIAREGDYSLFRSIAPSANLPTNGNVNMRLESADAYAFASNGAIEQAKVRNASLVVNFGSMQYQTRFKLDVNGQRQSFVSRGAIESGGRFSGQPANSNMDLYGALANDGNEAAYVFLRRNQEQLSAFGVLQWKR
jgi:hypothetical protein